jgi:eukaryotic-like serine/threonine-protein kinase
MSEPNKQPVQAMPLRLEGWKQIAAYMNRDVSTVQRWEKQAGLPVRRHRHGRRDVPYAYATDLDEWWGSSGPALTEESSTPAAGEIGQGTASRGGWRGVRSSRSLRAVLVVTVAIAAVAAVARWYTGVAPARVSLQLLQPLPQVRIRYPAVSPDGRRIAFVGQPRVGPTRLWVRALSATAPQLLPDSDDAILPFWSSEGRVIGYFARRQLRIVDVETGTTRMLAEAELGSGGTWSRRGVIVFARRDGLYKVSSSGGTPERVTALAEGDASHRHPQFLSDGEHFVFSVWGGPGSRRFELKIGSVAGIEPVAAGTAFSQAYAPPGYLLFSDAGSLVAQPFDAKRLRSIGEAHTIADALSFDDFGRWAFSVSDNGVLVYATEHAHASELVWMNRGGQRVGPPLATGSFDDIALSHDGRRIAVAADDESTRSHDIWMIDAVSGATVRLTHDPEAADSPLWSPDDTHILFSSARNTTRGDLFIRPATVDGIDELLWTSALGKAPQDWTPDGRLLFTQETSHDVWIMPLGKDRQPARVIGTNAQSRSQSGHEVQVRLSPDGRVLAYSSNVTGRWEVYLQSYPPVDAPVQISNDGGDEPRWSSDGRELFYRADSAVMSVRVTRAPRLQGAVPIRLFTVEAGRLVDFTPTSADRFLVDLTSGPPRVSSLTVVLNWNATR